MSETMMQPQNSSIDCIPRFATPRRKRHTFGPRLAQIADELGQPLMPWQRYVVDVGCEINPDTGLPAYREIIVTVPRQSGKTTVFLVWQLDRCLMWGSLQRSFYTAQSGKDARDKWLDELFPLIRNSKLEPLIARDKSGRLQMNQGMGNESIKFRTGSLIRLGSASEAAGHSKTLHQAVLDEVWHDVDDRREQAVRPAMITIPDAQLLVCSTAGTQASTVYNRKVAKGRKAVTEDSGHGVAYFEWSAPDDWDPEDEDSYYTFMPALGRTIGMEAIRSEREALEPSEFLRAYGNRPTASRDVVIPPELWKQVVSETASPEGDLRFGVDVAHDRASAAIASSDGQTVELIEHREGTGWVAERCNDLTANHGGQVALDFGGPAGVLADQINDCHRMQGREVIRACSGFYDAVCQGRIVIRQDTALDRAVEGVVKKFVSDQWVWSRKSSTADVTPLMATTLAYTKEEAPAAAPFVLWGG